MSESAPHQRRRRSTTSRRDLRARPRWRSLRDLVARPRSPEDCWPFWLAEDRPSGRSTASNTRPAPSNWLGRAMPLTDRATNVLTVLETLTASGRARSSSSATAWAGCSSSRCCVTRATPRSRHGGRSRRRPRRSSSSPRRTPARTTPPGSTGSGPGARQLIDRRPSSARRPPAKSERLVSRERDRARHRHALPLRGLRDHDRHDRRPDQRRSGHHGRGAAVGRCRHGSICKPKATQDLVCRYVLQQVQSASRPKGMSHSAVPRSITCRLTCRTSKVAKDQIAKGSILTSAGKNRRMTAIGGMGGVGKRRSPSMSPTCWREARTGGCSSTWAGPRARFAALATTARGAPLTPVEAMVKVIASFAPKAPKPTREGEAIRDFRGVLDGKRVLLLLDSREGRRTVAPLLERRPPTARWW